MVSIHAAIALLALSGVSLGNQTVLLDFYSTTCGPCREMAPTVSSLEKAGYRVQRVNTATDPKLASQYRVQLLPTFIVVSNGREVGRIVGKASYRDLETLCQKGLATPPPTTAPTSPALLAGNRPALNLADLPSAGDTGGVRPASFNAPAPAPPAVDDATLLSVSVRIRVEDPDGHSCGSGTVIDARQGEALVLTCGHIFRDSKGKGPIAVEFFDPTGTPTPIAGRLVSYNLENDVALVAIQVDRPINVARVAPQGYRLQPGSAVASVGCNNGDRPTVRRSRVNMLNRYQGPSNVEVAGAPVEGRSGGGLFSSEGYVVGVCSAADPQDQEGLFAAVDLIQAELNRNQLAYLYQAQPGGAPNPLVPPPNPSPIPANPGPAAFASNTPPAMPPMPSLPSAASPAKSAVVPASAQEPVDGAMRPAEQAALAEIQRYRKEGAEVVCIVRPRGDSNAKSQVIVIDHASPAFIEKLSAEGRPDAAPESRPCIETSLGLPKPRKVLLEWTSPRAAQ